MVDAGDAGDDNGDDVLVAPCRGMLLSSVTANKQPAVSLEQY